MSPTFAAEVRALCACAAGFAGQELQINLPHLGLSVIADDAAYLAQVNRALLHRSAAAPMALRVLVADRQSHPELIPPNFPVTAQGLGALLAALAAAGLCGVYDSDFDSWQLYDPAAGLGLQLLARPGATPPWERAFPLRNFLHWAAVAQNKRLLHAGTLGLSGRGVLLAGAGGAGKSGTVLAGLCHGLQSVGDDYILLDPKSDAITAQPVMRLMKQDQKGLGRLGLRAQIPCFGAPNWQDKYEFDFETLFADSRAAALNIGAILLPQVGTAQRSSLRPATPREVMFALLPNNLQQLPGAAPQGMAVIAGLTRDLPGYHLQLSSDPAEIAATLRGFLERDLPCV